MATIMIGLTAISYADGQDYETPERGTMLRRDLMNAIRPLAEQKLGDLRHNGDLYRPEG